MLNDKEAAAAFANAWNNLDCSEFFQLLADDAVYEPQWGFSPLIGKEAISHYLTGKLQTIKASGKKVWTELTTACCGPADGGGCVVLKQGDDRDADSVMVFEIDVVLIQIPANSFCEC